MGAQTTNLSPASNRVARARAKRSACTSCGATLTWRENIPLFSWLLQRGRCRSCKTPISWRYPLVEAVTAGLFLLTAYLTGPEPSGLLFARWAVLAGLVVATFVDFEFFEIPDQISIGGMFLAPVAAFLVPELHDSTSLARIMTDAAVLEASGVDRVASVAACFAGMAVGGGILIGISQLGKLIYRRDAMGFGDVKLLAAAGGFIGPGGALVALLVASFGASIAGLVNLGRYFCILRSRARTRGNGRSIGQSLASARIAARYLPFGPYLGLGIGVVLLAWKNVVEHLFRL